MQLFASIISGNNGFDGPDCQADVNIDSQGYNVIGNPTVACRIGGDTATNVIADANVNILDISQSVIREFFTMIMMVDLGGATVTFDELSGRLARKGEELGVRVEIQREEIFSAMHRI